MRPISIHEANARLSGLVDEAVKGKPFVISKAGKPLVKVIALNAPVEPKRIGFLEGAISVPDDFDSMGNAEIAACSAESNKAVMAG